MASPEPEISDLAEIVRQQVRSGRCWSCGSPGPRTVGVRGRRERGFTRMALCGGCIDSIPGRGLLSLSSIR